MPICTTIAVGSGAYAGCAYCTQTGEYSENLDKMVFLEHRRFLSQNDLLRLLDKDFPSGEACHLDPPEEKNQDYVDRENVVFSSVTTKKEQAQYSRKQDVRGHTHFDIFLIMIGTTLLLNVCTPSKTLVKELPNLLWELQTQLKYVLKKTEIDSHNHVAQKLFSRKVFQLLNFD